MSDEEDRAAASLVPAARGEVVSRSTALVRRGLDFLDDLQPFAGLTTRDSREVDDLRNRAERGDAVAQHRYGLHLVPCDRAQAVVWFRKAAEQGHAWAQCLLGMYYEEGSYVPKDQAQAVTWYRKAAEQGHGHAQWMLGVRYLKGDGVPQDYVEACKWVNLSALDAEGEAWPVWTEDEREWALHSLAAEMTPAQLAEAQQRTADWQAAFEKRQAK